MKIALILVPYDSGHRNVRMGAGPERLADPIADELAAAGYRVSRTIVEPRPTSWHAELGTAFELASGVAREVTAARAGQALPIVLAGNCFATLGVVAALGDGTGLIWWDAHADFNTPDTSVSGFLDGMALATIAGRSWTAMRGRVEGFVPVREDHVWLVGARDIDPAEASALESSRIHRVPATAASAELSKTISRQAVSIPRFALHVDLDVIDAAEGRANSYAVGGGVSIAQLTATCSALGRELPVEALTLSAYDPSCDVDGRVMVAATALVTGVASRRSTRAALPSPAH